MEAGDDTDVGHMDIRVESGAVTGRRFTLEPLTSDIPEDPAMLQLVAAARAPFLVSDPNLTNPGATGAPESLHEPITTVVETAPCLLTRKNSLDNSFNDFFTEALRTRAGTTLGMAPGFRMDSPIATSSSEVEGTITATGAVGEPPGQPRIRHDVGLLDVSAALANPNGERVLSLDLASGGGPVDPNTAYTIAGCRRPYDPPGVLCSLPGFSGVTDFLAPSGGAWTDVDIFVDALSRASTISAGPAFTDTSHVALWPSDAYVQPLQGAD